MIDKEEITIATRKLARIKSFVKEKRPLDDQAKRELEEVIKLLQRLSR